MSLFENTLQDIETFGEEFDKNQRKLELIIEYAGSTADIETKEAYLRSRAGEITCEEAEELVTEASKKSSDTIEKSVKALDQNKKKYFSRLRDSFSNLIGESDNSLKEIQDICKKNPKVGKEKIEYADYTKEVEVINSGIQKLDNVIARCKGKKDCTEKDLEEITKITDDVNKKRNNLKPTTKVIMLTAAIVAIGASTKLLKDGANKNARESDTEFDFRDWSPEAARRLVRGAEARSTLKKTSTSCQLRQTSSLLGSIKWKIKRLKGGPGSGKYPARNLHAEYSESVDDMFVDEDFTFDATRKLETIMENVINEQEDTMYGFDDMDQEYETMNESFDDSYEDDGYFEESDDFDDEVDVDALLAEAAEEAGLADDSFYESDNEYDDGIDVDSLLEEAAEESGLRDYEESVESLLDDFEDLI